MNRFKIFIIEFIVFLFLFILFFQSSSIDTIIIFVFLISSCVYIFALEALPIKKEMLKDISIDKYYRERINTYGYYNALLLICISLLYLFGTLILSIRPGVVILIIWFLMIIFLRITEKLFLRDEDFRIFIDYLKENIFVDLDDSEIKKLLSFIDSFKANSKNLNNIEEDLISTIQKNQDFKLNIDYNTLHRIISLYIQYKNNNLVSDEIDAINNL